MKKSLRILAVACAMLACAGVAAFASGKTEGTPASQLKEVHLYGYPWVPGPRGCPT
jgi:hypothetical protein